MRTVWRLATSVATVMFVALPASATASPATVVAEVPRVVASQAGPVDPNRRIGLVLTLRYRNDADLERLLELQADPVSSAYRHWLTPQQFNDDFAPSANSYSAVVRSLRRAGIRVDRTFPNRTVIDASGAVRDVERYFGTKLSRVLQPGHGELFTNVREARAPAEIAGDIVSVQGLDDLVTLHDDHITLRPQAGHAAPDSLPYPLRGPVSSVTLGSGYGPLAFTTAYDMPLVHQGGGRVYDGSGRSAAVVISSDFADSDLASYLAYFHIARTGPPTVRVPIDGGPTKGDIEAWLDVEAIVGDSPGVALYVYEFPNFNSNGYVTDAYEAVLTDDKADVVNSSFGGCEIALPAAARAWSALARQGAALGITFSASSGDSGAPACGGLTAVEAPADGPHVVSVGGTSLTVNARGDYRGEVAWNSYGGASGGGISELFAVPAWQQGVAGVRAGGRNVPDVAFDADPRGGFALYVLGSWNTQYNPVGGTSLSSPLFVSGLVQAEQLEGRRLGETARALYHAFDARGYGSPAHRYFHDVRWGNNGLFRAHRGYDDVTGIGSIDFWNVAPAF